MRALSRVAISIAIRCYPRAWREERAEEPFVLADELLLEGRGGWSIAFSFFRGAFDAHTAAFGPASGSPFARARRGVSSIVAAWSLFVPAMVLTIWLLDQPGERNFRIEGVVFLIERPGLRRFAFNGLEEAVIMVFALAAFVSLVCCVVSFAPVVVTALRRFNLRSLRMLVFAFAPGLFVFGVVIGLVSLQSSHVYPWLPPHEAHPAGLAPAIVPIQFGWNLSFSGLFLFATKAQIPAGLQPNVLLLALITIGEVVAAALLALGGRRLLSRAIRSARVLRFELLGAATTVLSMVAMWSSIAIWIIWEYTDPAASARVAGAEPQPARSFSAFVAIPMIAMAALVIFACRDALRSRSFWRSLPSAEAVEL
jgi:hypothetical protein